LKNLKRKEKEMPITPTTKHYLNQLTKAELIRQITDLQENNEGWRQEYIKALDNTRKELSAATVQANKLGTDLGNAQAKLNTAESTINAQKLLLAKQDGALLAYESVISLFAGKSVSKIEAVPGKDYEYSNAYAFGLYPARR
jgi:hypothetical protein